LILREPALSGHYVLEVSRPRQLDELKVMAELRPEATPNSGEATARIAAKLAHEIKAMIGVSAVIDVVPVGRVERSIGKAKRVIDLRPKG
jgi:phenylacetate-CoA ligase